MNRPILTACLAALAFVAGPAAAQDPNLARNLAATCANCHGTNGHAVPGATMPPLAGQPKESIVQRFREYRSGVRPATVMHQLAKGYTDAQVELIAAWLAAQKP
ncbi:MAG: cytochrome C [Azospira sp.]|jgi:cytochrome c553|nr:cytochrome C [Azospira sp.]